MKLFSIDDGSSYFKVTNFVNGNSGETVSSKIPSRVVEGIRLDKDGDISKISYCVNGSYYAVVDSEPKFMPTTTEEFQHSSPASLVLLHHALREAGAVGKVSISVTLPPKLFYKADNTKNEALIRKKAEHYKGCISYGEGEQTIIIDSVSVFPEGIPALQHIMKENKLKPSSYVIADLGGTTLDLYLVNDKFIIEKSTSINCGALFMVDNIASAIASDKGYGSPLPHKMVINGLLTGDYGVSYDPTKASPFIGSFKAKVMSEIRNFTEIDYTSGIICTGGGFALLRGKDSALSLPVNVPIHTSKDSQLDNSIGGLNIIGQMHKAKK